MQFHPACQEGDRNHLTQRRLNQRLATAQRLLETGSCSIGRIAEMAGFGSTVSLRQHFTRAFSISPASYRRQFRKKPAALAAW
ncbi:MULTISPECIES: helix-turn-helix domain-containing protein [unclassified Ensifer]|uniref:helix-turn-helix domain-containing protein n=1 Tax=unclassified Ensifer TaxID=2633371 RepID=UPI000813B054|nr:MULTISPECIES: helix-turn-helix domain-containing protein [unclassified Ensifer]OCP15915.1 hypothetical protein BC363_10815 [Ensifer sp. LC384]OCP19985.1 hypothetical protein BC361_04070 [Ensifer sp. LC54]OCP35410.1 hypothetical protein BC360_08995 [Ensifer sp. LC163]